MGSKGNQKSLRRPGGLKVVNVQAAGADLGSKAHYVALDPTLAGAGAANVRVFAAHSAGLQDMVSWLRGYGITSIAIEATGVYWMGPYESLEEAGIEVCLVNARHLKNVKGRKTDLGDAQWLQQLHSYGLLSSSFVPEQVIRDLRSYVRQRSNKEKEKSRAMHHIHKALDLMNVKVHHYIKNMDGVTGMKILRAMVGGQTDAGQLAGMHSKRLKVSRQDLHRSLEGNYRAAHLFSLRQALEHYDFAEQQLRACELEIEKTLSLLVTGEEVAEPIEEPIKPRKGKGKKNDYEFDVQHYVTELTGVNLTAIDGLGASTVLDLISELGLDLESKWPTSRHFTSWLRLAPQVKISGGKHLGHYQVKGANRAHQAFRLAAQGLANSKSGLGAYYRKMRSRKGGKVANKATARKIAVIYYHMMTKKEDYRKSTAAEYEAKYQAKRMNRLKNEAKALGFDLRKIA